MPKKVVFWLKKCEKFRIRHPKFFSAPMRSKMHFALNSIFSMENGKFIFKKIKKFEKFPNFRKFAKLFFGPKNLKKRVFFVVVF